MGIVINEKTKDILEWIVCILIAFILAILIKHFVFTPTVVKQISMDPTLKNNDRLILNRWAITTKEEIKRGEIITFSAPSKKTYTIEEVDINNPIAIYTEQKRGVLSSFLYNTLEITKESYIKRVIALPGEHITITENGEVFINNEKLEETYLQSNLKTQRTGFFYDLTVPEGHIFVMGDNRNYSDDSRRFGCIPIYKVEGKVAFRFLPFTSFGKVN